MTPLRGRGPKGKRLKVLAPYGPWKTSTFIAALRHDRIDALFVIDGAIIGEPFRRYVETVFSPALFPGDVVALGNLGRHESKVARAAIKARGAPTIFLPLYRPDPNPIEQVFSKLRRLIRTAQPRQFEVTWRKFGQLLDFSTPALSVKTTSETLAMVPSKGAPL